mgnify:CR=1 FL=1
MKKYCEDHGVKEMQQIQKAIQDRHAKELNSKKQLENAKGAYEVFKAKVIAQRTEQLDEKRKNFVDALGEKFATKLAGEATKPAKEALDKAVEILKKAD